MVTFNHGNKRIKNMYAIFSEIVPLRMYITMMIIISLAIVSILKT